MRIIKSISLFIAIAAAAFAQCPTGTVFPGSLDTPVTMGIAVNNLGTNLAATLSPSDTTMIVSTTTGWVPDMMATVDVGANMEIVFVTSIVSGTVLGISHPCEGTSAILHQAGAPVVNNVTAYSGSTGPKSAIYAIEAEILSGGPGGTVEAAPRYQVPYYSAVGTASVLSGDTGLTYNQPGSLLTVTNLAAANVTISGLTGITQCLEVNSSGVVGGTGSTCGGGGGSGTVNPALQGLVPYYTGAGTSAVLSGNPYASVNLSTGAYTLPGLTLNDITGSSFQCVQAGTTGILSGTGGPCGTINSGAQYQVGYYATAGSTLSGNSNLTFNGSTLSTLGLAITGISGTQCLEVSSGSVIGTSLGCATASGSIGDVAFYTGASALGSSGNLFWNNSTNLLSASKFTIPSITANEVLYQAAGTTYITGSSSFTYNGTTVTVPALFTSGSITGNTGGFASMSVSGVSAAASFSAAGNSGVTSTTCTQWTGGLCTHI